MKHFTAEQIQNIVFTFVVVVTMSILLLYNAMHDKKQVAAQVAADTPLPSVSAESDSTRFQSVPPDVLCIALTYDEAVTLLETDEENVYRIGCADGDPAVLRLSVRAESVASLTLTFAVPPTSAEEGSAIEKALAEANASAYAKQETDIQTILYSVVRACDLNEILLEPSLHTWYEGALGTRNTGKSYHSTLKGCTFTAYTEDGAEDGTALVIGVVFPLS